LFPAKIFPFDYAFLLWNNYFVYIALGNLLSDPSQTQEWGIVLVFLFFLGTLLNGFLRVHFETYEKVCNSWLLEVNRTILFKSLLETAPSMVNVKGGVGGILNTAMIALFIHSCYNFVVAPIFLGGVLALLSLNFGFIVVGPVVLWVILILFQLVLLPKISKFECSYFESLGHRFVPEMEALEKFESTKTECLEDQVVCLAKTKRKQEARSL
jgi:hypothetical protein